MTDKNQASNPTTSGTSTATGLDHEQWLLETAPDGRQTIFRITPMWPPSPSKYIN